MAPPRGAFAGREPARWRRVAVGRCGQAGQPSAWALRASSSARRSSSGSLPRSTARAMHSPRRTPAPRHIHPLDVAVSLVRVLVLARPRVSVNHLGPLEGEPLDLPDLAGGDGGLWHGDAPHSGAQAAAREMQGVLRSTWGWSGASWGWRFQRAARCSASSRRSSSATLRLLVAVDQVVGLHRPVIGRAGQARGPVLEDAVVHLPRTRAVGSPAPRRALSRKRSAASSRPSRVTTSQARATASRTPRLNLDPQVSSSR
jgi:hypothetical protein